MKSNEELLAAADSVIDKWNKGQCHPVSAALILARHVRESLAGEGEAITEEWLREIGFEERINSQDDAEFFIKAAWEVMIRRDGIGIWECFLDGMDLPTGDTKADVLSLLSALGIEVES